MNLAGATLLGLEKGNLVKKPFNLFVARQDQDRFYRHRKEVFETGKRLSCELRLVTKDGRKLYGRFDSHAVKDANDTISQCRTAISDVTKRKHAEGVLRLHEMRLQALLDLNKMAGASQQEILDFVREEVIRITQSQFAFIGLMNDNESVMRIENWSQ